jgi:hypothetical protein
VEFPQEIPKKRTDQVTDIIEIPFISLHLQSAMYQASTWILGKCTACFQRALEETWNSLLTKFVL